MGRPVWGREAAAGGRTPSDRHTLSRRRALMLGLAGCLAGADAAQAQDWLRGFPGFGAEQDQRGPNRREARANVAEPQQDLRTDPMPLRSEAMLAALRDAIDRYGAIAQRGGWPQIPGNRAMRPGDDDERVPIVRRRLAITGEMRPGQGFETFSFDGDLELGVRRFQEHHGLRVSGRVDRATLAAMNVSAQARVAQLQRNYQRIEELLGQRVEDRYIVVNVASFQLEAVEKGVVELRHRVIAGKPERQTPVVKAHVRALNFFPFWRVPDSVAHLDLIPRLRKEPEYLQKEHIRVLNGAFNGPELDATRIDWSTVDSKVIKFRQDPGPQNALGLVRLDMPNEHGVYMHDTPMKPLFGQASRAFSAGCVRVQDVFDLAAWVGREEAGMSRARVEEIVNSGMATDITLARPVPVYFTYVTAWAESNGRVEFRPDIYGRDGNRDLGERDPDAPPPPPQAHSLAP